MGDLIPKGMDPFGKMKWIDLEEKYLEEKYHPFNNLFLFYYMRFVGHMNPYNIEEAEKVAALTTELLGLVYKQFTDAEAEEEFKNVIRSFDDMFEDDVEKFKEDNATYPKSKYRLEKDAVYAEKRKESLLQALNILDPENTRGYKDDMSVDELDQIFKAAQKELDETQAKDYKSLNTSVETVTDTEGNDITVIKPNIITNAEAAESNDMNEAEESVIDSDEVSDENY